MTTLTGGPGGNISLPLLLEFQDSLTIANIDTTHYRWDFKLNDSGSIVERVDFFGAGFTYDATGGVSGGTVTRSEDHTVSGKYNEWKDPY